MIFMKTHFNPLQLNTRYSLANNQRLMHGSWKTISIFFAFNYAFQPFLFHFDFEEYLRFHIKWFYCSWVCIYDEYEASYQNVSVN